VASKRTTPDAPTDERGWGAFAEDGSLFLLGDSRRDDPHIRRATAAAKETCERLVALYRGGRPLQQVHGRTVVLVDDSIATGATARAAVRLLRGAGAARVIVAVPCGLAPALEAVRREADGVLSLVPVAPGEPMMGRYESFESLRDEQVLRYLRALSGSQTSTEMRR
jgi:putative phosphoribosyl transferase